MPQTLKEWAELCHKTAKEKGWWNTIRSPLEIHALVHSEVGEATEAVRMAELPFHMVGDKPEGEAVELADTIIRILDYFEKCGWNIETVMEKKCAYNQTREYRHGGKAY